MRIRRSWVIGLAAFAVGTSARAEWRVSAVGCPNGHCSSASIEVFNTDEARYHIAAARDAATQHANSRFETARSECQAKLDEHARQLNDAITGAVNSLDTRVLNSQAIEALRPELRQTIEAEVRRQLEAPRPSRE